MPTPHDLRSYADFYRILDQALESTAGLRLVFSSRDLAIRARQTIYRAREAKRREARRLLPPDHPEHGRTDYDLLELILTDVPQPNPTLSNSDSITVLEIHKAKANGLLKIEEL